MKARALLLALAISSAITACATTTSPTGRRQVVGAVSEAQLAELGAKAFAEAKAKTPQSRDSRQTAYVRCVVTSIVRQLPSDWQRLGWDVALFEDPEANAFALPGGKVGVYTGIFKVARNQDQLAGVIAHEIGHVVSHHHDERITRQMETQTGLSIIGALLGSRYGQGVADTAQQVGGVAAQGLFLLPNSRAQETEADVVGQQLMAKAGFDPNGAVVLWQNMAAAGGSRPPEWLSTHPDPSSRLRELQQRADGLRPTMLAARASGNTPRCQ
ncbi:M48 family metallopeptidase [Thermomonas sp.]|uniref:M48 family metallopeptidase n=1 Tax=Thermomonas sp. TaxID=1971895 RepID=UPI00248845FE|nr:M48 family metallopeptidase [Thermomonas sp.]MDI1252263.1 M48 family metallopeptidase [Thermomonas sp.]